MKLAAIIVVAQACTGYAQTQLTKFCDAGTTLSKPFSCGGKPAFCCARDNVNTNGYPHKKTTCDNPKNSEGDYVIIGCGDNGNVYCC
ncbi:hypothetical protein BUE80_DR013841 [Diplocarpon rosae]|nr:hypothetical protein BUE80_DR013841 [Diplocarpon rosae]